MLTRVLLLAALTSAPAARAAGPHGMQDMHDMHGMQESMSAMHQAMRDLKLTGDPDQDFVRMMIPHHQGAVDMARVYLKSGKNPQIRAMAEKIIKDQEREIKEFEAWLSKNPA